MIHVGDCIESLRAMEAGTVQTCITSPPYFGLRDYGHEGQIGLEDTPDAYAQRLVEVFREVWRVLRDDGTLWLNLGDSYAGSRRGTEGDKSTLDGSRHNQAQSRRAMTASRRRDDAPIPRSDRRFDGIKNKDLIGIPWLVAFALRADGWYLRQDIIWNKPNPMPESVRDRCTKAHEYLFLLSKGPRYYFDQDAIAEPVTDSTVTRVSQPNYDDQEGSGRANGGAKTNGNIKAVVKRSGNSRRKAGSERGCPEGTGSNVCGSVPWEGHTRNKRSVWDVATRPYSGAHFAVFPPDLIRPCVRAGAPESGLALDPFAGAGTTGIVCAEERRAFVGCEINPEYAALAERRIEEAKRSLIGGGQQLILTEATG